MSSINRIGFNTQPPEGGWLSGWGTAAYFAYVSTHSRPKAAGYVDELFQDLPEVSTHSRPKAAGGSFDGTLYAQKVSTHSRPKAAGYSERINHGLCMVSTHSRPKAAGLNRLPAKTYHKRFQHTAARRRLVSLNCRPLHRFGFNTQPPEGGWDG